MCNVGPAPRDGCSGAGFYLRSPFLQLSGCAVIFGLHYTSPQMESLTPRGAIKWILKKKEKKKGPDPISKIGTAFLGEKILLRGGEEEIRG